MRRISTATRLALTSSTFAIATGLATAASAEAAAPVATTAATPTTAVTAQDVQNIPTNSTNPADVINATPTKNDTNIVVTGSRIRRPNLESVVPVTSIQGEQFFRQGQTSVGDAL